MRDCEKQEAERVFVDSKTGEEFTEQSLWDNFITFAEEFSEEAFLEWVSSEGLTEKQD